ncbi:dienelactone hydrolase family protein [Qipengyuania sp. 6B39]|uniref:dienelactone hydrolase family protein n=1 Tax=Qipengyuania proteolytica TaxID=2867239 RepID=UPI001C89B2C6|nr:dienelactone hydrolase family protein [Qipengyuania proteolytica]MBX7494325.1 dienelactone hydrolase family protein [Qipengyuania proteolytica]
MCERDDLQRWARATITRRGFGAGALAGAAVACAPVENTPADTEPRGVTMRKVSFATPDGTMDGEFYSAAGGTHPGVILWPDIAGIRPAKRQMAERLAEAGYAVLLANPYYRDVAGQQFADFADFAGNGGWDKVTPWRSKFTTATKQTDARACAVWLMAQAEVDKERGIGAQGYCMTGSFALLAPNADTHIHAGGSFHGGGLVTDGPDSPHRNLRADAHYIAAIAQNDDAKAPGDKTALREAAVAVGTTAEIEVYPADHGWCVPDSPSYDEMQAERAWSRLLALYSQAL